MNPTPAPVETDELHAFVDGQLDPDRFEAVIAHLHAHPEAARQVAGWQAQRRALRRLHRDTDPGPTPPALRHALGPPVVRGAPPRWAQAAALAGMLVLGAAAGRWWPGDVGGPSTSAIVSGGSAALESGGAGGPRVVAAGLEPAFVREARIAHAVFTPERRHPVEVTAADDAAHLMQWLSRRLGAPLRTPELAAEGYRLLGGRLLPGEPTPRAQFMYENADGRRLTLFVTVFEPGAAPGGIAFSEGRDGDSQTFYWIDGSFGYALSAPVSAGDLQWLARSVHQQLGPR